MPKPINPRQKIFIAIFVIAMGGLLLDRVWLLPSQARDEQAPQDNRPSDGLLLNLELAPAGDTPGQKLTDQLQALSQRYDRDIPLQRDAFTLPSDWGHPTQEQDLSGLSTTAAVFVQRHQLKAVATLKTGGKAYVNDRVIQIGDTLDGFTLMSLKEDAAQFVREGETVTLQLTEAP